MIWHVQPGSGFRFFHPGSRGQKSTEHRIRVCNTAFTLLMISHFSKRIFVPTSVCTVRLYVSNINTKVAESTFLKSLSSFFSRTFLGNCKREKRRTGAISEKVIIIFSSLFPLEFFLTPLAKSEEQTIRGFFHPAEFGRFLYLCFPV